MATGIDANNRWVLVPDARFNFANLSTSSSYTEASPRPGTPAPSSALSSYALRLSGAQDVAVTLSTSHPGLPGLADGARVTWRKSSEAATADRSWTPPNLITQAVVVDATNTVEAWDIVAVPSTGELVIAWYESTTPAVRVGVYNPATGTVTSGAVTMPTGITAGYPSLVRLPTGRILMFLSERGALVSDDDGATWAAWARGITIATSTVPQYRRTVYHEATGALVSEGWSVAGASSEREASVSYDLGQSWTQLATTLNNKSAQWLALDASDGTLHRWIASATAGIAYYRWDNPASVPSVTAMIAGSDAFAETAGWVDPDGTLWCAGRTIGATGQTRLYRSTDSGATWSRMLYDMAQSGSGYALEDLRCAAAGGASWAVGSASSTGLTLLRLGGWQTATPALDAKSRVPRIADLDLGRMGIGTLAYSSGPTAAQFVAASATPANQGWTAAGTATETVTTSGRRIQTTANTRTFTATDANTETRWLIMAQFSVASGGSQTADDVSLIAYANGYGVAIRASTTGFRVRDINGTADRATVAVDMTTPVQVLVELVPGSVSVLYRRPYETTWTEAADAATVTQSGSTTSFAWGHGASTTSDSYWSMVSATGTSSSDYTHLLQWPGASTAVRALTIGRCLSSTPVALGLLTSGGEQLFAAALDGPAALGETFSAPVAADYGARNLFWDTSPSPRQKWRSTGTTEAVFQWDFDDATRINGLSHVALVVRDANLTTGLVLEAWNGAAWVGLAEWHPDVTTMIWSRSGDVVVALQVPSNVDGDALPQSGLVGGTALLAAGKYRRILQQNAGHLVSGGAQPSMRLDGIDGTEGSSGTAGTLYAPSGCVVGVNKRTAYTKFRVRIPSQTTANGYFEVGTLAVCSAHQLGLEYDWGWQWSSEPTVERTILRDGSQRNRATGPTVRTLTIAWPEGVDQRNYRTRLGLFCDVKNDGSWSLSMVSGATWAEYPAVYGDVPWLLSGLLSDLEGGAVPCAIVNSAAANSWVYADTYAALTTTDPTTWIWGYIQGPVTLEQVLGDDEDGEVYRVQSVSIREAT